MSKELEIVENNIEYYKKEIENMDKNLFNSPITYVYGSNLEECHKVIADLEAKLAVADDCADRYWKQIGVLEEENKKLKEFIEKRENCNEWLTMKDNENLQYEVNQLKHQLAEKEKEKEKEKELEYYKKQTKKFNNEAQKYFEDAYCNDFHTQDKISFCIEQLEKVKEEIGNKIDTFIDIYENRCVETGDLEFFINNQIKQLKEME